jgi:hypothetical protein
VLTGGAGVDGVRTALTGRAAKRALRAVLERLSDGSTEIGPARLRRAKFKPERRLDAYYDVRIHDLADGRTAPSRSVMVRWTPAEVTEAAAPPDAAGLTDEPPAPAGPPFRSLVGTEPAMGMHVRVSPFDPTFPQLARVCDPQHVDDALRGIVDAREPARGRNALPAVTAVRYRPGERHVLRYDLPGRRRGVAAPTTVFAKLYRPGDVQRAWRVATTVSRWLEDGPPGLGAARPLAVVDADDLLVYERCAGTPLSRWLRPGRPSIEGYLRTLGAGLRHLHRPPGPLAADLRTHTFAAELRAVASSCEHVGVLLPTAGAAVHEILDRSAALEARLDGQAPRFAHGDFKLDHAWVAAGRLTLIDHDSCTVAEPALDVGKFLADLHWWTILAGCPASVGPARAAFLAGYGADDPEHQIPRARLYEVLILTKVTARRVPLWDRRWDHRTRILVDRAAALIAALERDTTRTRRSRPDRRSRSSDRAAE